MTNLQLFIAVVIPSALMVVNLLSVYRLEGRVDSRLDKLGARLDWLDGKLDRLSERVQAVEVGLAGLRAELFEKFQPKTLA